ncbi:MAG: hypothetical protein NT121_14205 [Chloroflexi bacterium]|nr:hypothetical protein [Chloroflexota bacterium]
MNERERFNATMHYQPVDRCPMADYGFWDETIPAWHEQGLPIEIDKTNIHAYLGMDYNVDDLYDTTGVDVKWYPKFPLQVLEDRGDHEVIQQDDGVQVLRRKFMSSIPHPVRHLLTDRASWRKYYKPRLDPSDPGRYPADWDVRVDNWRDPQRPNLVVVRGGGLYGYLRNWMGLEALSLVIYDDPAWFSEMVETLADCSIGTLERVLGTGGIFDACAMWEDMCYNAGPLLSPKHFRQYLMPHYRRITDLLHSHGVDFVFLDCDGNIEKLAPLWMDVGINTMFPFEVGTWHGDPLAYRKHFGKEMRIIGGFDKNILMSTPQAIEAEVQRLAPLVHEGGFIPHCDHLVPPYVPYQNYLFYLQAARRVWGQNDL